MIKKRADHEIKHGEFLASGDTSRFGGGERPQGSYERNDAQNSSRKRQS